MNNLKTLVVILLLVLFIILLFYLVRIAVMIWTGCSAEEATRKIHAVMSPNSQRYHFKDDVLLIQDLWKAVRAIIGDARFNKVVALSQITPIFLSGEASGIPYIALAVPYNSASEKMQAETLLSNILQRHLVSHGLYGQVLVNWTHHMGLQMPFIMLRYAETPEEKEILANTINQTVNQMAQQNGSVTDEDIDDV